MSHRNTLRWFQITVALLAWAGATSGAASAATPYQGYTFCASGANAYLLDMSGVVKHTWHASGNAQTCAYLLPDGSALFPIPNSACGSPHHDGAFPHGRFQKIGWDGVITWDYRFCDATVRAGYDVHPMPNGNILIPTDATGAGKIFEVQPTGPTTGAIVWQYSLPNSLCTSNTYMNSVSYNPALDQVLIDLQEPLRRLVVINHATSPGTLVRTVLVPGTGRVHAAQWVHRYFLGTNTPMPDADSVAMRLNHLLVVHNGGDRVAEFDRLTGVMTTIPFAFQDHEGSVQRLPNGNTLVTSGGGSTIYELDDAGTIVGTIAAPGTIQRAYRYGPAYGGVAQLFTDVPVTAPGASTMRFEYDRSGETGRVSVTGGADAPVHVRVFAVSGALVRSATTGSGPAAFSTAGLASGVYFVRARHGDQSMRARFVIVR